MIPAGPRLGWYGDDFTGATDTLAVLAQSGFRALLFLDIPTDKHLAAAGPLDALGIAGATRAMAPEPMAEELTRVGRFFADLGVDILHYKCCSTFDSAPHVGSIGLAVQTLRRGFRNGLVPIIGGQPNLGRYCLFGNLFAAAGIGGEVHRIDRHPTMSVHPVTPMGEGDLRRHLAQQGLSPIGLVDYRAYETPDGDDVLSRLKTDTHDAVLMDVSRVSDLTVIGRAIWHQAAEAPLLAVGPSSVVQALVTDWPSARAVDIPSPSDEADPRTGPFLALVGSLSPVTRAQAERTTRFTKIGVEAARLVADPAYQALLVGEASTGLAEGLNVMLITDRPQGSPDGATATALATAALLKDVLDHASISRLVVAGGDTSSLAIKATSIWGLSYRAPMVPGAPLCRAHSDDPKLDGLDVVLKGGQMGPPSFFDDVVSSADPAARSPRRHSSPA